MKLKYKFKLITAITIVLFTFFFVSFNLGARYHIKHNLEESDKSVFKTTEEEHEVYKDELIIYDALHRMANSKIKEESKDKLGMLEVTQLNIEALKTIVSKRNYPDKDYILEVLTRWQQNDFSMIMKEHEYFYIKFNNIIIS